LIRIDMTVGTGMLGSMLIWNGFSKIFKKHFSFC
jgi:hypothetical protein